MEEVAQNLFVGTAADATDESTLRAHEIEVIVSLTATNHAGNVPAELTLVEVPMMDGPQNSQDAFETAVDAVVSQLAAGEKTLLHCSAGASRSPAVAAAALALHRDSELEAAFQQILTRRPEADPHDALIRQAHAVYQRGADAFSTS
ncbi:dual specificity protein phosphatase [Haloplanus salilacus]|uniref:protein-tyrosine phosphatase family protein n=1 Tax=Haloplanus salilacus TaxID=2949994 RepID=UPI0030D5A5E4